MNREDTGTDHSAFHDLGYFRGKETPEPPGNGRDIRKENYEESAGRQEKQEVIVYKTLGALRQAGASKIYKHLNDTAEPAELNERGERYPITSIRRALNNLAGRNKKKQSENPEYQAIIKSAGSETTLGNSSEETFEVRDWVEIFQERAEREAERTRAAETGQLSIGY